jgi:hypothetical protein
LALASIGKLLNIGVIESRHIKPIPDATTNSDIAKRSFDFVAISTEDRNYKVKMGFSYIPA